MATAILTNRKGAKNRVLFLSNENYCCGRFCEEYFNQLATENALDWKSTSRALNDSSTSTWTYPMSPIAIDFLRRSATPVNRPLETPCEVTEVDLRICDVAIALDESENRPQLAKAWPQFSGRIRYWRGGVLNVRLPNDVFELLSENVHKLIEELSSDHTLQAA